MSERTKAMASAIAVLAVNVAAIWGISVDANLVVDGLCAIAQLAALAYAIWKNHNFTPEAAEGQAVTDGLKAAREHARGGE